MRIAAAAVVLALFAVGASAADPDASMIRIVYYECTNPVENDQPCCWYAPERRAKDCPTCTAWKVVEVGNSAQSSRPEVVDAHAYDYSEGPPRANAFLNDVSKKAFGVALPRVNGSTIKISDFYKNPRRYGWKVVSESAARTGALALLPHVGGVVVDKSGDDVRVVYPSDKRGGTLAVTDVDNLGRESQVKYVVPVDWNGVALATTESSANVQ